MSGAPPPPTVRSLGGLLGSTTRVLWARACGGGAQCCPLGLHALWGLPAAGVAGGRARGGWPATVVRGVWCQALYSPNRPSSGAGSWGTATRVFWVRLVRAWGPSTGCSTACALAGPALLAVGLAEGRPWGGAFDHCEGRLVSGVVPPPVARPLERATRVPLPVCPGCGRCGRGDPAPAPQRAPLRAGVARCGGGGRASPGGCLPPLCEGRLRSLPRLPAHWAGCWGPPPMCCGRGCVGVGAQHCPPGLHALWGLHAVGVVGSRPRRGVGLPPL